MATVTVTDETFDADVLKADKLVLVDFWATWCGPCRAMAPALEQVSDEFADQVTVAKVDITDSPETPTRMGVKGVPTLMLFRGGEMISMKPGAMSKAKLVEWLGEQGVAIPA